MRPLILAAVLGLGVIALALAARAQTPPPDPPICNSSLREWGALAASSDYQAMERLLARTLPACRQLRSQIQARITALRPAQVVDACETAQTRWAGLRTSTDRAALQRFITDTPTRCAIREAAVQRLASLPTTARPPATTTTPPTTTSTTWRAGQEFDDCSGAGWCPRMVVIPAGSFMMGSTDTRRELFNIPQRRISVSQFAVGKFEITFDNWSACVSRGGCNSNREPRDEGWGRGSRPVLNVSWNDAQEYVRWLSRETDRPYRLLTEAEWEYAARAGSTSRFPWGDLPNGACEYANIADESWARLGNTDTVACDDGLAERTAEVGRQRGNAYGLFDMIGNIWEWVEDCESRGYSAHPANASAFVTPTCSRRNSRGGSFESGPDVATSTYRVARGANDRYRGVGFRVARTLN